MACSFKAAETGEIQSRLFRFLQIAKLKPEKFNQANQFAAGDMKVPNPINP